jgi:hypothetical protein
MSIGGDAAVVLDRLEAVTAAGEQGRLIGRKELGSI